MKYIITQEQMQRLLHCNCAEVAHILISLKPLQPMTEGEVSDTWLAANYSIYAFTRAVEKHHGMGD